MQKIHFAFAVPFFFFFFFFFIVRTCSSSPTLPDRFLKKHSSSSSSPFIYGSEKPQEYIELTQPLPSDYHRRNPSCAVQVLDHDFGYTFGSPPVSVPYSPPSDCPSPWTSVVLDLRASCRGEQYDRIAAIWLGGAEILRTSTAEPTESGIFWKVQKDVTRYSSLLARSGLSLTMMLENIVNDVFTGVYHIDVSFLYYRSHDGDGAGVRVGVPPPFLGRKSNREMMISYGIIGKVTERLPADSFSAINSPADMVIPISGESGDDGFWFRIQKESDIHSKKIQIPRNTRRAVLELYVSYHGDDEFWYSNPPDSYIELNQLNTGRGHGSFREVFVTIDGTLVASEIAFPVIFTGGINPLFWQPVVAIGAFDLPSYDTELTPFLGLLLDGKPHEFRIGVGDGISFWLIDANLHLWLDQSTKKVEAKSPGSRTPTLNVRRISKFNKLDGSFAMEGRRRLRSSGFVISSAGNLTTQVSQSFRFRSSIHFRGNGTSKSVHYMIRSRKEVMVVDEFGNVIERRSNRRSFPLKMIVKTIPGKNEGTSLMITNVTHSFSEKSMGIGEGSSDGNVERHLVNRQESEGWMEVKDHDVLSGGAETRQSLSSREGSSCYFRTVATGNGKLVDDKTFVDCSSSW